MKLHDLRPADGARRRRTRVGRGIAAGQGKTAGRGTKGQKARAGGSIPPWFEGGQTPLHQRIPKLRGFRNPFKVQYEVVNIGRIGELVAAGRLEAGQPVKGKPAPITINQEILRATGLVSTLDKPLKILGHGELTVSLFVVADAFTKSARAKIEAAGGSVQLIEIPSGPLAALGVPVTVEPVTAEPVTAEPVAAEPVTAEPVTAEPEAAEPVTAEPEAAEPEAAEPVTAEPVTAEPAPAPRRSRSKSVASTAEPPAEPPAEAEASPEPEATEEPAEPPQATEEPAQPAAADDGAEPAGPAGDGA
jgi:large subunit ribosomal protein L15